MATPLIIKQTDNRTGELFKVLCALYGLTVIIPALFVILVLSAPSEPDHGGAGFALVVFAPVLFIGFGMTLLSLVVLPIYLRRHWSNLVVRTLSLLMIVISCLIVSAFALINLAGR